MERKPRCDGSVASHARSQTVVARLRETGSMMVRSEMLRLRVKFSQVWVGSEKTYLMIWSRSSRGRRSKGDCWPVVFVLRLGCVCLLNRRGGGGRGWRIFMTRDALGEKSIALLLIGPPPHAAHLLAEC
jgi:hypothetical protein